MISKPLKEEFPLGGAVGRKIGKMGGEDFDGMAGDIDPGMKERPGFVLLSRERDDRRGGNRPSRKKGMAVSCGLSLGSFVGESRNVKEMGEGEKFGQFGGACPGRPHQPVIADFLNGEDISRGKARKDVGNGGQALLNPETNVVGDDSQGGRIRRGHLASSEGAGYCDLGKNMVW